MAVSPADEANYVNFIGIDSSSTGNFLGSCQFGSNPKPCPFLIDICLADEVLELPRHVQLNANGFRADGKSTPMIPCSTNTMLLLAVQMLTNISSTTPHQLCLPFLPNHPLGLPPSTSSSLYSTVSSSTGIQPTLSIKIPREHGRTKCTNLSPRWSRFYPVRQVSQPPVFTRRVISTEITLIRTRSHEQPTIASVTFSHPSAEGRISSKSHPDQDTPASGRDN